MKCEYGCDQDAKFQMKNGKWCCSYRWNACFQVRKRMSESHKGKEPWNKGLVDIYSDESRSKMGKSRYGADNPFYNKKHTDESKKKQSEKRKGKTYEEIYGRDVAKKIIKLRKGKTYEELYGDVKSKKIKTKQSIGIKNSGREYSRMNISLIHKRYKFFSKIEEMRHNPDKPGEVEVQVRCKNHECKNSKEQGGWFTPTYIQFYERIRQLEKDYGNDGCYFYCSDKCKSECPLYQLRSDPFKETEKLYTSQEYQIFRKYVIERDNYKCQYCNEKAEHVHHERPQKLEPFFVLDPDLAWSVCAKCHYEKGHTDECSTGNLSKIVCQ